MSASPVFSRHCEPQSVTLSCKNHLLKISGVMSSSLTKTTLMTFVRSRAGGHRSHLFPLRSASVRSPTLFFGLSRLSSDCEARLRRRVFWTEYKQNETVGFIFHRLRTQWRGSKGFRDAFHSHRTITSSELLEDGSTGRAFNCLLLPLSSIYYAADSVATNPDLCLHSR